MESISLKELWMLLGEKDVQIYQFLKEIEVLSAEIKSLRSSEKPKKRTDNG